MRPRSPGPSRWRGCLGGRGAGLCPGPGQRAGLSQQCPPWAVSAPASRVPRAMQRQWLGGRGLRMGPLGAGLLPRCPGLCPRHPCLPRERPAGAPGPEDGRLGGGAEGELPEQAGEAEARQRRGGAPQDRSQVRAAPGLRSPLWTPAPQAGSDLGKLRLRGQGRVRLSGTGQLVSQL